MDGQKKWVDVWTDVYMDEQTIDIDILSLFYWSNKRSIMFFIRPEILVMPLLNYYYYLHST